MTTFVHIGIGKTGTTSIQGWLHDHRCQLAEHGLHYPQAGLLGAAHHGFFDLETSEITESSFDSLAAELAVHADRSLILSSENLAFAPEKVVEQLRATIGSDSRIIFYVRDQLSLIPSIFLQWVKDGWDYGGSIEEFFARHEDSFDFCKLIHPWAMRFGDGAIDAHVYSPNVVGANVVQHFLSTIGLQVATVQDIRLNPSLLPEFVDVMAELDAAGTDRHVRQTVVECLVRASVALAPSSTLNLVSDAMRVRIQSRYAPSNAEFAMRYLSPRERAYLI
ncbi:MAG: hypothetical protein HOP13_04155 [Alphaproteobacteria bacterium]|nr:hypothetical protein [Alphaproteobacteria bacterium]